MGEKKVSLVALFAIGIVLELIFSLFPQLSSVHPLLPIAVLVGVLYGVGAGAAFGFFTMLFSVFLVGPVSAFWFQLFGSAFAGAVGGAAKDSLKKVSAGEYIALCGVVAIVFEILLNLFGYFSPLANPLNPVLYFDVPAIGSALNIVCAILFGFFFSEFLQN